MQISLSVRTWWDMGQPQLETWVSRGSEHVFNQYIKGTIKLRRERPRCHEDTVPSETHPIATNYLEGHQTAESG